jgi:alanine dehydrogenase
VIVGVPKEIKDNEYRVALTPFGAEALVRAGHRVLVQAGAGEGSGFSDDEYRRAGAEVVADAAEAWAAELVVKVKEPQPAEYQYLREGLILFAFLHLAAAPELARQLVERGVTAIAYETVRLPDGSLPLLAPMSAIAGRMAPQIAAQYLTRVYGGRGKLLAGVPGVAPARVVVLGAGTVGTNATRIALGMGAQVTLLDRNLERLRRLDLALGGRAVTMASSPAAIAEAVRHADAVIGAVLVPGGRAPILVTEAMVAAMQPGAVIIDVAVDQGGCVETIRPTTHSDPVYTVHGVLHYGVTNMPAAVPRTATMALCDATLPYVLRLAEHEGDIFADEALELGVNTYQGVIIHAAVAAALGAQPGPPSARAPRKRARAERRG